MASPALFYGQMQVLWTIFVCFSHETDGRKQSETSTGSSGFHSSFYGFVLSKGSWEDASEGSPSDEAKLLVRKERVSTRSWPSQKVISDLEEHTSKRITLKNLDMNPETGMNNYLKGLITKTHTTISKDLEILNLDAPGRTYDELKSLQTRPTVRRNLVHIVRRDTKRSNIVDRMSSAIKESDSISNQTSPSRNENLTDGEASDSLESSTGGFMNRTFRDTDDTKVTIQNLWFIFHGVLGSVVEVVGIVGNVICIIVLSHPDMRNSTGIFLISLAVYDILVLTSHFCLVALEQLLLKTTAYDSFVKYFYNPVYPFFFSVVSFSFMGSNYTTVVVSIERFLVVTFPLKASAWCTKFRAKVSIILLLTAVVLYNIPRYLVYNLGSNWDTERKETVITLQKSNFARTIFYKRTYSVTMNIVTKVALPLVILTSCSIMMVKSVTRTRRPTRNNESVAGNYNKFTAMVVAVVFFSMFSLLTGAVEAIMTHSTQINKSGCLLACSVINIISEFSAVLNSGINFVLYCFFGTKFREVFKLRFCKEKERNELSSQFQLSQI